MKNVCKYILSRVLVLLLVLSLVPMAVFAAQTEADQGYTAKNTTTGQLYTDISAALRQAQAGETVALLQDVPSASVVTILEDTTLDLNGHSLTARYVSSFGQLADNSETNTGLLVVSDKAFLIREKNAQIPVRTSEGYRFVEVLGFNEAVLNNGTKYVFQPLPEIRSHELLLAGQESTGVTINVRVSWTQSNGRRSQTFEYNDRQLSVFLNSFTPSTGKYGQMFSLTLNNAESFTDLTFEAVVVSTTGVELTVSNMPDKKPVEKFESTGIETVETGATVTLGELFTAIPGADIHPLDVYASVSPLIEGDAVSATFHRAPDWTKSALTFTGTGEATITINDYYYCIPTTITVNVCELTPVEKFEAKAETTTQVFTPIALGDIFTAIDGAVINDATITVTGGTYVPGATWAEGSVTFDSVGEATVTITDNDLCIPASATVTVTKADPTYTVPTGLKATFGQTLADVQLPAGFTWADASLSVGGAGTNSFTAIYTPTDTANYNTAEVQVTVNVVKAVASVTSAPTAKNLIYTGSAQELVSGGIAEGGKLVYSTAADGEFTETIPTGTNAGIYLVYYKVQGDDNHFDSEISSVTVIIAKAEASVTKAPAAKELTYTGSAQALVSGGTINGGKLVYSLTESGTYAATIPTAKDAGTYTVYYKVEGDENYNGSNGGSVTVTIAKAVASCTVTATKNWTYDGVAQALVTTTNVKGGSVVYSLAEDGEFTSEIPTAADAGTYTVYYKVLGNDNYIESAVKLVTVTVDKAQSAVTAAPVVKQELTYNKEEQPLVDAGTATGGEIWYKVEKQTVARTFAATRSVEVDEDGFSPVIPTAKNAGTYTVYYKVKGDGNHNDSAVSQVTVTVKKAKPVVTLPQVEVTYGDTLEDAMLTVPEGNEAGTLTWQDSSSTSVGNAGTNNFTATFVPEDTENYEIVEVEIPVQVQQARPTYEHPTGLTAIYGQTLAVVNLPEGFTWKDASLSVGNAGTNTFTVVFDPGDSNYQTLELDVQVIVAKADPTYTVPTGLTATYDDLLASVTLPEGFTWKDASQSAGNAGEQMHTAIFTPADTNNYNTAEVSVTVVVAKASVAYTGNKTVYAVYGQQLSEIELPIGCRWVNSNQLVGNAGNNAFNATYVHNNDSDNYNAVDVVFTVSVAKADPEYENPSVLTAKEEQYLRDIALPVGFAWKYPTQSVGKAGTNSFTAIYTPTDTANYNTVEVEVAVVVTKAPLVKFESKFTGDFLYRVGNQNTVALGNLFKAKDGAEIGAVSITIEAVEGTTASGTYTPYATWTNGTIQFSGTGVVKVTITDNEYCIPTELYLEVVDAVNATAATSATSNNVVLLNDISGGFTVSGRYTVYGNGFTLNYTGNGEYLNNGLKQGVVTVSENGTLDNLRIKASIYPSAYMYYGYTLLGEYVQGGPYSTEGDKTRYHYQLSAVAASGNATISNCYIYGGRNNIFVNTGDVTIKDSVLECGVVANVQIQSNSSHTVTFENVTTIQHQMNATIGDTNKVMLGAGVLVGPDTNDNPTIVLNGEFKQYNWVNEADEAAVSSDTAKMIIGAALGATDYNHTVNGKTASNLGIIYMNTYDSKVENNTGLPYKAGTVTMSALSNSVNGNAYSLQGATAEQIYSNYENADRSTVNGLYAPQFKYPADLGGQYIAKSDDDDEHCYREGDTIHVMFPSGDTKELDLAALVDIQKYTDQDLALKITCKDGSSNEVTVADGKITLSAMGEYTVTYTVTDTLFFDKDGNQVSRAPISYSWDITVIVSLKDTSVPDARFDFVADNQKMGYYKPAFGDVKQYLPFLAGLKIYDYNGKTEYLRFDGDNDFNKVASITITGYASNKASVEIKLTDGGVINTQFLARANSGGASTYTGKIKTSNNTIYFVNDGGTSSKDTTTTAAYWYVDYYKFTGNNGVAIQSTQQTFNSSGRSASTPSGNFSTTIKYTVTFDANEGNCGQTVGYATSASTAVTLPTPTRSGYLFSGWFTAASGGTRVGGAGESYTPSANITLYAQWGKPSTVTYDANGGNCGTASEKYTGTALTLPTPTRDGYWFIGWYDAAEGGNKIGDAGATYNPTGDITLYAQWQEAVEYTVTYNANGGTCGTASATYQGTALTLPTPTKTGYNFLSWYDAASGGNKIGDAGASYIPEANITLYAQWSINSYTITVTTSNATVKVNGSTVNNNNTLSVEYGSPVTVEVTYSESDNRSTTIKGTDGTTYTSPFNMPAQNVTINATSSSCVGPDTLITLADGTQVRVDSLTGQEELLVWNMVTGQLDSAPILFVDSDPEAEMEIVHLYFSDGTDVKVIYEHGFWDYDLNRYVYLDRYAAKYIGHTFAKQNGDRLEKVTLTDVVLETEVTTAWSPVTAGHLCYFVNGMLSMPGGVGGLFNIFEVDPETMTYDQEAMAQDIETYGLFTYEELNSIEPLSEEMFEAAGGAYLKISIGKGNLTMDELVYMIRRYSKFFN